MLTEISHGEVNWSTSDTQKRVSPEGGKGDDPSVQVTELRDFGAKYKLSVENGRNGRLPLDPKGSPPTITLFVSLPGWDMVQETAVDQIRKKYGESFRLADGSFDFAISIDAALPRFDTVNECATELAKIRTQAIGAPISRALLDLKCSMRGTTPLGIHLLPSQGKCGSCHCFSTCDK